MFHNRILPFQYEKLDTWDVTCTVSNDINLDLYIHFPIRFNLSMPELIPDSVIWTFFILNWNKA